MNASELLIVTGSEPLSIVFVHASVVGAVVVAASDLPCKKCVVVAAWRFRGLGMRVPGRNRCRSFQQPLRTPPRRADHVEEGPECENYVEDPP